MNEHHAAVPLRDTLLRQFDTAWSLATYHLTDLTTAECLWRPAGKGLHVTQHADGTWHADWPEHEGYSLGPPSMAWITWHMTMWWRMVLDHTFGPAVLTRHDVRWPGSAEAVRDDITTCATQWRASLLALPETEWASTARTRWPYRDRPLSDVVAWATVELTKNAAELGYARFAYAVRAC